MGEGSIREYVITDTELRLHHDFVHAFETLRKRYGHREMSDAALRDVAEHTGLLYETLRIARHLRNAITHDDPVNGDTVRKYLDKLAKAAGTRTPPPTTPRPSEVSAYRVHAWKDPRFEQEEIANGYVALSADEIGDLTGVTDPEVIRALLTKALPEKPDKAINLFVGYWRRFLWEATPGDLVVLPTCDHNVAIGEFVGPHFYVPAADPRARHRREVSWTAEAIGRDAFGPDLLVTLNGHHTIQDFKAPDAVARLRALAESGIDPGPRG